jgi:RecA-family ATPase
MGEEEQDELDRRVAAVCQHHRISEADLGGRLFAQSVRDRPMRIAVMGKSGPAIDDAVIRLMIDFLKQNRIDVFMVDPLVSFHDVAENDNTAMDKVIKQEFAAVAGETNAAPASDRAEAGGPRLSRPSGRFLGLDA